MEGCIQEITQKLPSNVGVSIINKKAPVRRLFKPEAFHLIILNTILMGFLMAADIPNTPHTPNNQ